MTIDQKANQDYERAIVKAFWRTVVNWLTGKNNDLLPFEVVRSRLPFRGQRYIGLRQVQIDKVVGSMGRYRDFDRAFLPKQMRTKDRWVSIDRAHYSDTPLPPVELYKMGDVYFVKDGNHRVSVARERGQIYVDAYITEIDVPVPLSADLDLAGLELKREYAYFIEQTRLTDIRQSAYIEMTLPGEYERLLEHISVHRWYLGEKRGGEVPYVDAVASWYDSVYLPLVENIREHGLAGQFPGRTEADLYLWIIEYQWYRREAYKEDFAFEDVARQFIEDSGRWPAGKLVKLLRQAAWVDHLILQQERSDFLQRTRIYEARPEANIEITVPGLYERLLEHISVHRWYLGERRGIEVSLDEAALSWYDNVYTPLVSLIRGQNILEEFPSRTESDLYLWIIENQSLLLEAYGDGAAKGISPGENLTDLPEESLKEAVKALKKHKARKKKPR